MDARLYQVDLPPEILSRGFWLYAWEIAGPGGEPYCYVGMTGDVTGVAQSPYVRAGAHLGFNENSNALRRLLVKKGVTPESCKSMTFLAYGPVLPYSHQRPKHPDYEASRKRVGALERKLWSAAEAAHNTMLNERPRFAEEFDETLWEDVRAAFARHVKLSIMGDEYDDWFTVDENTWTMTKEGEGPTLGELVKQQKAEEESARKGEKK